MNHQMPGSPRKPRNWPIKGIISIHGRETTGFQPPRKSTTAMQETMGGKKTLQQALTDAKKDIDTMLATG